MEQPEAATGGFLVDARLEGANEVLQVPVIKTKALKRMLAGVGPRPSLLGPPCTPTVEDPLDVFLQRVGPLLGKDPTKWEQTGDTKTDITTSDDGTKRIITRTGVYSGTELHLWAVAPYHDSRLPIVQGRPDLCFDAARRQVTTTEEWRQITAEQPWTASRRRQLALRFLQAKLAAPSEELQLEGACGLWELSINRDHHQDLTCLEGLGALVARLSSPNVEVARTCAAAAWGLAVSEGPRRMLQELGAVEALVDALRRSLDLDCRTDGHSDAYMAGRPGTGASAGGGDPVYGANGEGERYTGESQPTLWQRQRFQATVLGALSVMLVDRSCRAPFIKLEPACATLFALCRDLEGYPDAAAAALRREAAARTINSLMQRDPVARASLIAAGGVPSVLALLDSEAPGSERVQYYMAALLATLVLDKEAMAALQARGEGPPMFRTTLRQLAKAVGRLKRARAPSAPASSGGLEGATQQHGPRGGSAGRRGSTAGGLTGEEYRAALAARAEEGAEPAPLTDVEAASVVSMADACAQGMWGSAHYCMTEPLEITPAHVVELGKLGMDCLILSECPIDLGRSCHCVAATLATLAANEPCARFIMDAPGGSVVRSVLALVEVEDDPCFSRASDVRAAACTALAFLACHPLGARGDACLTGPFRPRLLQAGSFGALLRAALSSGAEEHCDTIIQQTAAVGIMYLSTMAGAVDPAELAMYAALMTSNTNVEMVEYLMAGMWILLKVPANRKVLGGAFKVNPASSALASTMVEKLQDTIEVADVNEHVNRLAARAAGTPAGAHAMGMAGQQQHVDAAPAAAIAPSPLSSLSGGAGGGAGVGAWPAIPEAEEIGGSADPSTRVPAAAGNGDNSGGGWAAGAVAAGGPPSLDGGLSVASLKSHGGASVLGSDIGYGALAAAADTLDDKLAVVEHKRRSILFNRLASVSTADDDYEPEEEPTAAATASPAPAEPAQAPSPAVAASAPVGLGSQRQSLTGGPAALLLPGLRGAPQRRVSVAGSVSSVATSRGVAGIKELSETLRDGTPTPKTLEGVRSLNKTVQRSIDNLDTQLGSALDDHWGLDTLVRVGETWLPRMLQASAPPPSQQKGRRRAQQASGGGCSSGGEGKGKAASPPPTTQAAAADVPLLKLFEFLTASLCLYVIDERPPAAAPAGVWAAETGPADGSAAAVAEAEASSPAGVPRWWTIAAAAPEPGADVAPLLARALRILMTSLELRIPAAWKSVQLSVVMLWNAAVQSVSVEHHQVDAGVASCLLTLAGDPCWPPTLRDMAAGHLQHLMETHRNLLQLGTEHRRRVGEAERARLGWGGPGGAATAGGGKKGSGAGGVRKKGAGALTAKFETARERAEKAKVAAALASVSGSIAATLGTSVAAAAVAGASGAAASGDSEAEEEERKAAALEAVAGSHPGLVPFMLAMVGLISTGHPLLELRGARGIARSCFSAPRGVPAGSGLLREAKATAAEAGAVGALVELLRRTASKYMVALEGGVLPPPPSISALSEGEYTMYERDMANKAGMLELLLATLGALLNLTTLTANQPAVARRGLTTLLSANTSLYTAIMDLPHPSADELRALDLLAAIIQNLAAHPRNRTRLYRAELRGSAAMDRVLHGPSSPEPTDTSAALSIARDRLLASSSAAAVGAATRCAAAAAAATAEARGPWPMLAPADAAEQQQDHQHQQHQHQQAGESRGSQQRQVSRGASPQRAQRSPSPGVHRRSPIPAGGLLPPTVRVESPAGRPSRMQGQAQAAARSPSPGRPNPSQLAHASSPGIARKGQPSPARSPARRAESPAAVAATSGARSPSPPVGGGPPQDPALAAATTVRPKVLFPPIGRPSNPDKPGGGAEDASSLPPFLSGSGGGGWGSPQARRGGGGGGWPSGRDSPMRSPQRPRTVGRSGGGGCARSKSARSHATSLWAAPGSPIAPPDTQEQFLIWLDSTFGADADAAPTMGYRAEAQRRRQQQLLFLDHWGVGGTGGDGGEGGGGDGGCGCGTESRGLKRLLCRPLHHLWQDSPEAYGRQGNARWSPAISEYREVPGPYNLHAAARPLLQCAPPPAAPGLQAATTQVLATGRLAPGGAASAGVAGTQAVVLDRPSTRQRHQGQSPLTVLQPRRDAINSSDVGQGLDTGAEPAAAAAAAAEGAYPDAAGARRVSIVDPMRGVQQQEQEPAQQQQEQTKGDKDGFISLKIALSPQRPRTLVAFDERVFTTDSGGARPVLTLFEHVEGSKVSEGLFTEYTLPNGRKVFMYCAGGSVMDEADIGPVQPPPRPTTVPLALQQSMPLAEVLDFITMPPGSAPPFVGAKPVPRLVPLPLRHTLPVRRPDRLDAAAFGALPEDNLQIVITANPILKTTTATTEEDVYIPAKEEREPWTLPMSIFKARAKEADARAFHDGGAVLDKMWERDWGRACAKDKFMSMLARENRACAAGKPDKVMLAETHDAIKRHYQAIVSAFTYYASQGGNDPYHLPLNAFTAFLDDAGIPDSESQYVKRSDCDTIFIVANYMADKKSPEYAVCDEHAMMRFQFVEAIVRLAIAKYGKGQETDDVAAAVEMLLQRNLGDRLPLMARVAPNDFRNERLYNEEVDLVLKKNQVMLKALYNRYRLKPVGGGLRPKTLRLDGWLALVTDAGLVDSQFTLADATLAFLWSRMHVIDEVKDYGRLTSITFTDFLEALGRSADLKSLPTASDLDEAGYSSILEWALDKERLEGTADQGARASTTAAEPSEVGGSAAAPAGGASEAPVAVGGGSSSVLPIFRTRPSARFGAPKPRPLYAKLELLLDLIFRRLYWDPSQPDTPFSVDALLRAVRKIDKDLGP